MWCGNLTPIYEKFAILKNFTNFTRVQINDYIDDSVTLQCAQVITGIVSDNCFYISGLVGFFSFMLMFLCLRHVKMSGCTMIYHKATVILEFPHMLVMAAYGLFKWYSDPDANSYALLIYTHKLGTGWTIGDSMKLAVSTLTMFLSLERCIAVCLPNRFAKINRKSVAYCCVAASLLIGCMHMWAIFVFDIVYDDQEKLYVAMPTWFSTSSFYQFTVQFIYFAKIILCVAILCLNVTTATVLWKQAKKAASMTGNAKKDWMAKKQICTFSYIVGILIVVDHVTWVTFKILDGAMMPNTQKEDDPIAGFGSYQQAMWENYLDKLIMAPSLLQAFMGQLVHGWRFYIYLAFNKSMRDALRKILRCSNVTEVMPFTTGNAKSTVRGQ